MLGIGPAARQMSEIFDHFWNSKWVVPGYAYAHDVTEGYLQEDAAIKFEVDISPVVSGFVRLHAKGTLVDRSRAYIGSFNLDPCVRDFNTEMGILIDSPGMAEQLSQMIENLMQPENSWQVQLDRNGKLIWVSGNEVLTTQPAQSFWQQVQDVFLNCFSENIFKEYNR